MTKINLAPTTKEELTEKLKHYFLSLGNLNELRVAAADHDKIAKDITSAFIDTLTKPTAEPSDQPAPLGYVIAYTGDRDISLSGSLNRTYHTKQEAQTAIKNNVLKESYYKILPVHAS